MNSPIYFDETVQMPAPLRVAMRPSSHPDLLSYVRDGSRGAGHVILIDPNLQSQEEAAKRAVAAVSAGSRMVFVGGSTGTDGDNVHATVVSIQEALELCSWNASQDAGMSEDDWKVPVVLFPAGAHALSSAADGITFMMLMNSRERQFLVGEQVMGAPYIKEAGVTPLSMGYVICAPGGKVGEVGRADLLQADDEELAAAYAVCAEAYGFSLLYLEAGSGAETPVPTCLIRAARNASEKLVLIVGGGIRDGQSARAVVEAGADYVVTGNLTEQFDDTESLRKALSTLISEMRR